jgi:hypothetical protein
MDTLTTIIKNKIPLELIQHQTYDICLHFINQDGMNLKFVTIHCPNICLAAVKQNGLALRYIAAKDQTPELDQKVADKVRLF